MKKKEDSSIDQDAQIAFKDFKNAITQKEFSAVIDIVESEYFKLKKALDYRSEFVQKLENEPETFRELPQGLLGPLSDIFLKKSDKELVQNYSEELKRSRIVVDFINRFRMSDDMLEYHDLSFLSNLKNIK